MTILTLVRHGQSQWNLENRFTGWVDVELTDKGREEARAAGQALVRSGITFTKAYTSELIRAQKTLEIILGCLGCSELPVQRNAALNERHYGDLQGLDKAETARKYGDQQVHIWRRSYDVKPPGGESLKDTAARTLPYFDSHIAADLGRGETILVSAHGNSLRSIVMHLDGLSKDEVLELNIATGVPIIYELDDCMAVVSKRILDI